MKLVDDSTPTLPINVGIAPEAQPVVLADTRPEKPRNRDGRRRLILPGETESVGVSREEDRHAGEIVNHLGEPVSSLTWANYLAWRKTKCRPFDREALFALPGTGPTGPLGGWNNHRVLEEIDQATHEFVGEVAELGALFMENGPTTFFGDNREKLIDEIGDILFCGAWVLDAWGMNPLYKSPRLELIAVNQGGTIATLAKAMAEFPSAELLGSSEFLAHLSNVILPSLIDAQTNAGLLCNSFKKLRFQRREQDVQVQVGRVGSVLLVVSHLLAMAGSRIEEALQYNQRKLDARYPNGYQPGQGGGNRTGEGK